MDETVKTPKPSSRRAPHLERPKVVAAALGLLNEVGFEGLTLRKLAAKLDVKAAALYWHFENKQDLIDEVAGAIVAEEMQRTPLPANAPWREVLTVLAYATRGAFMRYRDGALVIASADLSKSSTPEGRELVMQRLLAQGVPPELTTRSIFTISRYTLGCVLEEQADPHPQTGQAVFREGSSPDAPQKYPAITQALTTLHSQGVPLNADALFQRGLEAILDGIAVQIDRAAP